jgi:hypothetical protein
MGRSTAIYQAGGRGFEPLSTDPESVVLPLDEPPPFLPYYGSSSGRYFTMPEVRRLEDDVVWFAITFNGRRKRKWI